LIIRGDVLDNQIYTFILKT